MTEMVTRTIRCKGCGRVSEVRHEKRRGRPLEFCQEDGRSRPACKKAAAEKRTQARDAWQAREESLLRDARPGPASAGAAVHHLAPDWAPPNPTTRLPLGVQLDETRRLLEQHVRQGRRSWRLTAHYFKSFHPRNESELEARESTMKALAALRHSEDDAMLHLARLDEVNDRPDPFAEDETWGGASTSPGSIDPAAGRHVRPIRRGPR